MSYDPIIETSCATPVYVDELSIVKTVGAVTHLVFSSRQPVSHEPNRFERIVQQRMIVPTDQLNTMARALLAREAAVRIDGDVMGNERPVH
jgi:hypothetical protein